MQAQQGIISCFYPSSGRHFCPKYSSILTLAASETASRRPEAVAPRSAPQAASPPTSSWKASRCAHPPQEAHAPPQVLGKVGRRWGRTPGSCLPLPVFCRVCTGVAGPQSQGKQAPEPVRTAPSSRVLASDQLTKSATPPAPDSPSLQGVLGSGVGPPRSLHCRDRCPTEPGTSLAGSVSLLPPQP